VFAKQFGIPVFKFYHNFELASYSVVEMKEKDLIKLNNYKGIPYHIKSAMFMGIGIGMSMVIPI